MLAADVYLRETYTIGRIIALLDRLQPRLEAIWQTSGVSRALNATIATGRNAPIQATGIVGVDAVLINTLLVALDGSLSTTALLLRVTALGIAFTATRVNTPWDELAQSRTVQLLRAALEPPEPPNEQQE